MEQAKTRVLVTGGTGFLGGHVTEALMRHERAQVVVACRDPSRLPSGLRAEIRAGDLLSPRYRHEVVEGIDVLCHVGTWGAFFGHAREERQRFFTPALDLLERFITQGGRRFLIASSVAVAAPSTGEPIDSFAPPLRTGYWPHLDLLVAFDEVMRRRASECEMVSMRLGHFVGAGIRFGLVPALVPRLKTRLVPWLDGGRAHLPLVSGTDMGTAFALAALQKGLERYESFNIVGPTQPTLREVFEHIAARTGAPLPWFGVSYALGHAFGWLMERLHPLLPGKAPFLTRSLVHVAENRLADGDYAERKLGYRARVPWKEAVDESIDELERRGYPWPALAQAVTPIPATGSPSPTKWIAVSGHADP